MKTLLAIAAVIAIPFIAFGVAALIVGEVNVLSVIIFLAVGAGLLALAEKLGLGIS